MNRTGGAARLLSTADWTKPPRAAMNGRHNMAYRFDPVCESLRAHEPGQRRPEGKMADFLDSPDAPCRLRREAFSTKKLGYRGLTVVL